MNRTLPLLIVLLLPGLAHAQPARPPDNAAAHLSFSIYAAGLRVLELESDADIARQRYRIDIAYHTVGLFGALLHSEMTSFVQGQWLRQPGTAAQPSPLRFAAWGTMRGKIRRTTIDYEAGQPVIRALEPAQEADRDPVPAAQQRDTIDTLSSMAMLVRAIADTGKCEGHTVTFDGRRVLDIEAHTVGMETLQDEGRSSFRGLALRCDFDGHQLAGFQHDTTEAELHRIHHSTAWLARVLPDTPPLPVRVQFETGFFGHATAYLTNAVATEPAAAPTMIAQPKP